MLISSIENNVIQYLGSKDWSTLVFGVTEI